MLEINVNSPVPIYEQLIAGIRAMIENGELAMGESLPSIRNLSSTLEVAANTVARAYSELERQGWVRSYGVKGTFVCGKNERDSDTRSVIAEMALKLGSRGYSRDEISRLVEEYLKESENI